MKQYKVIVTGPESTGKTALCRALAEHYHCNWVPEYARIYVEQLDRRYNEEDILHIARHQESSWNSEGEKGQLLFFDTWLIITKVWLEVYCGRVPSWIEERIEGADPLVVLLCFPDLPWEPDTVRENGGEMRMKLFRRYQEILDTGNLPFEVIKGHGETRLNNAIHAIEQRIRDHGKEN